MGMNAAKERVLKNLPNVGNDTVLAAWHVLQCAVFCKTHQDQHGGQNMHSAGSVNISLAEEDAHGVLPFGLYSQVVPGLK